MKVCCRCHKEKAESEFWRCKRYKDGLLPRCKACEKERQTNYRHNNMEKFRIRKRRWIANHRESERLRASLWYWSNRERGKKARKIDYRVRKYGSLIVYEEYKVLKSEIKLGDYLSTGMLEAGSYREVMVWIKDNKECLS